MFSPDIQLQQLNELAKGNMVENLGIEFTEIGESHLAATMPVDERTKQPMGLLHGGASVALAETLGSVAATLLIDVAKQYPVGLDINANHVRAAREGKVKGICKPVHIGKHTHVWEIRINNEQEQLICISRITMAILNHKN